MAFSEVRPSVARADATLREIAELLIENHTTREVYLVDEEDRFYGLITAHRFGHYLFTHHVPDQSSATELLDLVSARNAHDLAIKKAVCVSEDDSLETLLDLMFRFDVDEIPVVDSRRAIVGKIGMLELIAAWHAETLDGDGAGGEG
jgi:CBS domain-containing protein